MTVETIIKQAETIVIGAETKYINDMLNKYDNATGRPMLQENIQNQIVDELTRQSPKGKFDEEEAIMAKLTGFFKKKKK